MGKLMSSQLLAVGLLLAAAGTASAQYRCGVFALQQRRHVDREYRNCEECLNENAECEERCVETGYACTAIGYDRHDRSQVVQGDVAERERYARKNAVERCKEQGLLDCAADRCTEEKRQEQVQPCQRASGTIFGLPLPNMNNEASEHSRSRRHRPEREEREPEQQQASGTIFGLPLPNMMNEDSEHSQSRRHRPEREEREPEHRRPPSQPQQPYVVSWQHVKDQCLGQPYHKIKQQCGNRVPFWHGISCQVTWSDGRTEKIGGKVDLTDPYGRPYCTRATRPVSFNCVSRCDDTPGPLINLPRP